MTSGGKAYALSGSREKELEQFVGQRVEIVGTLERGAAAGVGTASDTATTSGTTTAGTTAGTSTGASTGASTGTTASGAGTASGSAGASQRFSELQQINIVSFRAVGGSCAQ